MPANISIRQRSIMDFIRQHDSVQVDDLSKHLQVTPQTIRRDLNQLYELKLAQGVHGGIVINDAIENLADVDMLITDSGISDEFVEVCHQSNVEVKIAKPSNMCLTP